MVNRTAQAIAKEATGNIKEKHLIKDSGMLFTYLYDGPLINHLNRGEQPEYVFSHENKGYRITEPNGDERTPHHISSEGKRYLLITDQRVLYVAGCTGGDETIEHGYDEIIKIGRVESSNIQFRTVNGKTYKFAQNGSTRSVIDAAINYISERASGIEPEATGKNYNDESEGSVDDGGKSKKGVIESAREGIEVYQENVRQNKKELNNSAQKTFFSQERAEEFTEYVDDSENIEGILKISGITHDDDGGSFFGENDGGGIRNSNQVAIFTDRRILTRLPSIITADTSTIMYENIKSVETKSGILKRKLIIRTSGEDYHLVAFDTKEVVNVASEFVRKKIADNHNSIKTQSEESPIEKIEKLKDLRDKDAISEEEFESKKEELLDKI